MNKLRASIVAIVAVSCIAATGADTPPAIPDLDRLWNKDRYVSVHFEKAPAAKVLDAIAAQGKLRLRKEGPENCCLVSLSLVDARLREALEAVASITDVRFEVIDAESLFVRFPLPLNVTADMTGPQVLTKVEPNYPNDAREAHANGTVLARMTVREDGTVADVELLTHVDGWPSFDDEAVTAARQWTFRPAIKNGRPVSVYYSLRVDFRIETPRL